MHIPSLIFVSVCLEQTLGMAGILFKYFSCCAMLAHSAMLENSSFPTPLLFFCLQVLISVSGNLLFFPLSFLLGLCFLCHNFWQLCPLDHTDRILSSDSILTPEAKLRNYYSPIAIVPLLFFYPINCTYVQLYRKG